MRIIPNKLGRADCFTPSMTREEIERLFVVSNHPNAQKIQMSLRMSDMQRLSSWALDAWELMEKLTKKLDGSEHE